MSAYQYTTAGRAVYVLGRSGRWWFQLDRLPAIGDRLDGPHATRAAAIAAATAQLAAEVEHA